MPVEIQGYHHVTLTVSDVKRATDFYVKNLGFQVVAELPQMRRILMNNGKMFFTVTEAADPSQIPPNDAFSENRIGLDHFSFAVQNREAIEEAVKVFDANGVPHGTINDLSPHGLPLYVMSFRDPDNIQLELSAPA